MVTSGEVELNFPNICGNPTISASRAPSVAFEWYTIEYLTRHLYFLVYTRAFDACVYTEKIQMFRGIYLFRKGSLFGHFVTFQ